VTNNGVTLKSGLRVVQGNYIYFLLILLNMVPFESFGFAFHSNYGTMALSCIISEIKRNIGQKSRFFMPLHSMPH